MGTTEEQSTETFRTYSALAFERSAHLVSFLVEIQLLSNSGEALGNVPWKDDVVLHRQ